MSYYHFLELLSQCNCGAGGGGSDGRVQWDPARDLLTGRWPIVHYSIFHFRLYLSARHLSNSKLLA